MAVNPSERLGRLALDLVRIASPSGEEREIALFVERFLGGRAAAGFVRRHGNAVVAGLGFDPEASEGAPREPEIILAGHLDTVPLNGHPEPELADGMLAGLGSTDMKGALAVMLAVAEDLAAAPGKHVPVGFVFYDCEEVAYERNGLRKVFAVEPWTARAGFALLMEPTGNVVELGCLGTLHARVTFHGTAAHSARPWTGENAIHKAGPFLARLGGATPREVTDGPATFREVVTATLAEGGSARNVVPDRFTLNVNLRFAPDRSPEEAEAYVRSILPNGVSVEIADLAPAAPARTESPWVRRLVKEERLPARAKQAWTDVAQFALRGVPAANLGPGVPELAHKRDESVPVENLVRAHEILGRLLRRTA